MGGGGGGGGGAAAPPKAMLDPPLIIKDGWKHKRHKGKGFVACHI